MDEDSDGIDLNCIKVKAFFPCPSSYLSYFSLDCTHYMHTRVHTSLEITYKHHPTLSPP